MKSCASKLTLVVAGFYTLAASPFWLGFCEPSMHEGTYSLLFTALNAPALMIVSSPAEWAQKKMCPDATLHSSNLLTLFAVLLFWSILSFGIGSLVDWRRMQKRFRDEEVSEKIAEP